MTHVEFRSFVETIHSLHKIPFTLCYTSLAGDLLPITNDEVCIILFTIFKKFFLEFS